MTETKPEPPKAEKPAPVALADDDLDQVVGGVVSLPQSSPTQPRGRG